MLDYGWTLDSNCENEGRTKLLWEKNTWFVCMTHFSFYLFLLLPE